MNTSSDSIIIIPTYNEKDNAERMVRKIMSLEKDFDVLFVDDGSPDGTADIIRDLQKEFESRVFLEGYSFRRVSFKRVTARVFPPG